MKNWGTFRVPADRPVARAAARGTPADVYDGGGHLRESSFVCPDYGAICAPARPGPTLTALGDHLVKIVEKLLRAGEGRTIKKLQGLAAQVNALEEDFVKLTDAELREALALRFAAGFDYAAMSEVLGVGESTLRSRVHHGLRQLHLRLRGDT